MERALLAYVEKADGEVIVWLLGAGSARRGSQKGYRKVVETRHLAEEVVGSVGGAAAERWVLVVER